MQLFDDALPEVYGYLLHRCGDLALAEGSSQAPVQPPRGDTFSHTLHLQVDDVDATVRGARAVGAQVEREPGDEPYGRVAVLVDPFGHRWLLNQPPARATRYRQGDVAYATLEVADAERARQFYGAVLGWQFSSGSLPGAWNVDAARPVVGLWGRSDLEPQVQLCYRVDDVAAAAERVRACGGAAGGVDRKPYGLIVECVDDQGASFLAVATTSVSGGCLRLAEHPRCSRTAPADAGSAGVQPEI